MLTGRIVCSKAGRDKGEFMVVLRQDASFVYLINGKSHTLLNPKRKNIKHIAPTNNSLTYEQIRNDKSVKAVLKLFSTKTAE